MLHRLGAIRVAPQRPLPSLLGPERPIDGGEGLRPPASPPASPPAFLAEFAAAKQLPGEPACGRPRGRAMCGKTNEIC